MLSEDEVLLRLLEISALLLPVVAILLQVTLRLYTSDETAGKIGNEQKRRSTLFSVLAIILLLVAGANTVLNLLFPEFPVGTSATLSLIGFALLFIGYSVGTVGLDAINAFSKEGEQTRLRRFSLWLRGAASGVGRFFRSSDRINTIRRKVGRKVHPELPEDEEKENGRK